MKKAKVTNIEDTQRKIRPALAPDARKNQLISLAIDLAEKQLMEDTASRRFGSNHKFKKIY